MNPLMLSRRSALLGLTAAFSLGGTSLAFGAAPTDKRFVVIVLRGALDGMSAVQPYGDPNCADLRGELALPQPGTDGGVLDLGGFYGLHPSLTKMHALYKSGDVLILHATAGNYRSRSHFEAQDYLECGVEQRLSSGWLNRAVAAMPGSATQDLALSMGLSAPLVLRGPARVEAWAPDHFGQLPAADLYTRLTMLTDRDPLLGPALREALSKRGQSPDGPANTQARQHQEVILANAAGKMLAAPNGPRVAVLEIGGWDTHSGQLAQLKRQLSVLDDTVAALHESLGDIWRQTAILAVTEFGRTARVNGTKGTDHGTAGVAFIAGGAVAGGRVRANWPGLSNGQLFEARDLAPTTDVRAVCKGLLAGHLGIGPAGLEQAFPGSDDARPMAGLLRV
jgi:uncharacterized protein (DUF1501 family)